MKKIASLCAALLLAFAGAAVASGGAGLRLEPAPVHRLDVESLQRGARNFVNYCLNCHSAKFMRYERLTDIGLTADQIRDNLMFGTDKIGSTMTVAMPAGLARSAFGTMPPDLSVQARVRGSDWLYNYFLSFYRDEQSVTGWNNLVFPNVGMPHALWTMQGAQKLVATSFAKRSDADAAAIAAKGLALVEPVPGGTFVVKTLAEGTPGAMTPAEYRAAATDLVNFMAYVAEPSKLARTRLGLVVLMFLGVLFVFAYWLKREYWKDVH